MFFLPHFFSFIPLRYNGYPWDILSKAKKKKKKKKHSERDPFPIGDIKEQRNIDRLTGVFHKITNLSLENGSFPKTEKEASVKPTLKSGKDQQNVESYRLISNFNSSILVVYLPPSYQGHCPCSGGPF